MSHMKKLENSDRFATYLVSGFIRKANKTLAQRISALWINYMTLVYYRIVEKFNESDDLDNTTIVYQAGNILVHGDQSDESGTWEFAAASGSVSAAPHSGVYMWAFQVLSSNHGQPCADFGIIQTKFAESRSTAISCSALSVGACAFRSCNGQFYAYFEELCEDEYNNNPYSGDFGNPLYGKALENNDVIVMTLDTDQRSLTYAVNNVCYGRAPLDVEAVPYTMIVGVQGDKLQLVSFRHHSRALNLFECDNTVISVAPK